MSTLDFSTVLLVNQSPKEAFDAINNVRGWWSEEVEGGTDKLNDEFTYHYKDVHRCKMKLIEVIPEKKVVWLVLDNYFSFTKDKSEWRDTKVIFEIEEKDNKTQIRFTHKGLVPEYECFDICSDGWNQYIRQSLFSLITTGKGKPNTKKGEIVVSSPNYKATIMVDSVAKEVFDSINNVTKWWTENLEGNTQKLGDEFTVRFGDVHFSKQKLIEVIPNEKVVWLVTDSKLNFVEDKHEWTNTKISFEITNHDDKTQLHFTHIGLVPEFQCYNGCVKGWDYYIKGSLYKLLTEGKGMPGVN